MGTIFTLSNRPERGDIGVGSMLNSNHEGPAKRPTEKAALGGPEADRKELSRWNRATAKHIHLNNYLDIRSEYGDDPSKIRRASREFRRYLRDPGDEKLYMSAEETKNLMGTVATALALHENTSYQVEIPEEPSLEADLYIKRKDEALYRLVKIDISEGKNVAIVKNPESAEGEILTLGDELFDITTGDPFPIFERELEKTLESN